MIPLFFAILEHCNMKACKFEISNGPNLSVFQTFIWILIIIIMIIDVDNYASISIIMQYKVVKE